MAKHDHFLEIEAKLLVDDLALVESRLAALGATARRERVLERNIRYEDAGGTLTPAGIILRLRQDSQAWLTYKGPAAQDTPGLQTRFEAEVTVDDFDVMDLILRQLGYRPLMIYEKYRTTYALRDAEIVLDEMPFGRFVEIEGVPDAIEALITALGLTNATRFQESYAQLFDHVRAHLGLTFHDLTFENFAGIVVPPEAFRPPES
jgi:adenylate cyclase class 2